MKFSGHETFTVREGWLHKGMKLVHEQPELFRDVVACSDALGVGTSMAKSIRHWLQVMGLARTGAIRGDSLQPTSLGSLVWESDPYFADIGTWWLLHVNLIRNKDHATTWYWFFNHFAQQRFDRTLCGNQLRHYLTYNMKRPPTANTLNRDIGCLLASYARPIPDEQNDPEDYTECPFIELGLMSLFSLSGSYEIDLTSKAVPPEVLGYCLASEFGMHGESGVTVHEAATAFRGPGRVFLLTSESLFDLLADAERELSSKQIALASSAGERMVKFDTLPPEEWIANYYKRRARSVTSWDNLQLKAS